MQLKPLVPFEPVKVDQFPTGEKWIAQVKWDGVRVLTYYDGSSVRLFNRRLHERTLQYPELININSYCSASSVILDGEIIALSKGKPSFQSVMKRDSVRQAAKVSRASRETPIIYMIFDILFYNGEWVINQPLKQRQEILGQIISPQSFIQLVENFDNASDLFEVIKSQDMEGVVCKDLNSAYAVKGKDSRWQKLKYYHDLIAVVGGVTFRGNLVNALLLGLYDQEGRLWYIGHAGTGKLTSAEWRTLTEFIQPMIVKARPFVNKPERIKSAVWVEPVLTVKVNYIEWTQDQTLRQPSIQAFVQVKPQECLFHQ